MNSKVYITTGSKMIDLRIFTVLFPILSLLSVGVPLSQAQTPTCPDPSGVYQVCCDQGNDEALNNIISTVTSQIAPYETACDNSWIDPVTNQPNPNHYINIFKGKIAVADATANAMAAANAAVGYAVPTYWDQTFTYWQGVSFITTPAYTAADIRKILTDKAQKRLQLIVNDILIPQLGNYQPGGATYCKFKYCFNGHPPEIDLSDTQGPYGGFWCQ